MSKKLLIAAAALLAGAAIAGYEFVLAKPAPAEAKKISGELYVLGREFLVNLADGRYAKLTVALELSESPAAEAEGEEGAAAPPEGYGPLPQEAVVRDVVSDVLTGADAAELTEPAARQRVKRRMLRAIRKRTDVPVAAVLLPDITVQ